MAKGTRATLNGHGRREIVDRSPSRPRAKYQAALFEMLMLAARDLIPITDSSDVDVKVAVEFTFGPSGKMSTKRKHGVAGIKIIDPQVRFLAIDGGGNVSDFDESVFSEKTKKKITKYRAASLPCD